MDTFISLLGSSTCLPSTIHRTRLQAQEQNWRRHQVDSYSGGVVPSVPLTSRPPSSLFTISTFSHQSSEPSTSPEHIMQASWVRTDQGYPPIPGNEGLHQLESDSRGICVDGTSSMWYIVGKVGRARLAQRISHFKHGTCTSPELISLTQLVNGQDRILEACNDGDSKSAKNNILMFSRYYQAFTLPSLGGITWPRSWDHIPDHSLNLSSLQQLFRPE